MYAVMHRAIERGKYMNYQLKNPPYLSSFGWRVPLWSLSGAREFDSRPRWSSADLDLDPDVSRSFAVERECARSCKHYDG